MVHDEVWAAAGLRHDDGWVCLRCLSNRLGRKLVLEDFTDYNDWIARYLKKLNRGKLNDVLQFKP